MWDKIKNFLMQSAATITAFFVCLWLAAWCSNALGATKFDLSSLKDMYLSIIAPKLVFHGIDSKWNSEQGVPPGGVKK